MSENVSHISFPATPDRAAGSSQVIHPTAPETISSTPGTKFIQPPSASPNRRSRRPPQGEILVGRSIDVSNLDARTPIRRNRLGNAGS